VHTCAREETDRWACDPTGQSQREGGRRRRPQLAGGEVSGEAKATMRTTSISRTRWHTRGGQRSSDDQSPLPMAEWWRGWSPTGHPRPCHGHRKGARALVSRGKQDTRARKAKGGAERSGPRSRNLRRARPCSGEQFTWRGGLPRATDASNGCARERRSSGQDEAACGELAWPERQRRRWRTVVVSGVRCCCAASVESGGKG
jgi:hypothetical protein